MASTQFKMNAPKAKNRPSLVVQFALALLLYCILLTLVIILINALPGLPLWARFLLALVPVSVDLWVTRVVILIFRGMDELQQRVQLESMAIAFVLTVFFTLTYGVLQTVGLPALSWIWTVPLMATCWLAGLFISTRNYFRQ